jgi:hypothetical protein
VGALLRARNSSLPWPSTARSTTLPSDDSLTSVASRLARVQLPSDRLTNFAYFAAARAANLADSLLSTNWSTMPSTAARMPVGIQSLSDERPLFSCRSTRVRFWAWASPASRELAATAERVSLAMRFMAGSRFFVGFPMGWPGGDHPCCRWMARAARAARA